MDVSLRCAWVSLALLMSAGCGGASSMATTAEPSEEPMEHASEPSDASISLPNARRFEGFTLGGLPSKANLDEAVKQGVETVLSLMDPSEEGIGEIAAYGAGLGLRYLRFTVRGEDDLTEAMAWEFAATLGMLDDNAIVHCRSGQRVAAMFALKAFFVDERSAEEALAIGRELGLTRLEARVAEVIGAAAAPTP